MEPKVATVSQINNYIKAIMEQTPVLQIAAYEDALKKSGADKTAVIDVKYGIKKAADKIFVQATLYYDTKISVYGG